MKCSICIKNYTGKHRRKVICQECSHDVCSSCLVKYITSTVLTPCCMYCKAPIHICLYKNIISSRKYAYILKLNFEKRIRIEEANIVKQQDKKEIIQSVFLDVIRCNKCDSRLVVKNDVINSGLSELRCVLCETVFCDSCFSEVESDSSTHTCVHKIKTCPKCYILIEKQDVGCDQMFCVSCNTTFSWDTGLIIDVAIPHNPHYYRWKNETGELSRHELDDPREGRFYIKCETDFKDQKIKLSKIYTKFGFPSVTTVDKTAFLLGFHIMFSNTLIEVSKCLEREAHIRYNLRVCYLSNSISTSSWKKNLKKHFYLIKQCEAIKYNILKTLNMLYTLVLDKNSNDAEIETLCLQAVKQTDRILKD